MFQGLPLHPIAVHLPLGLAAVLPFLCVGLALAIGRQWLPARAWWLAIAIAGLVSAGAYVAVETGEDQHDRVEEVVAHERIEEHEEAGEWFLWASALGLLATLAGLAPSARVARAGRIAACLVTLLALAAALRAGHLGGRLVYVHGAASAYTEQAAPVEPPAEGME